MSTDRVEQAGGVVFRSRDAEVEILLVRSKKDPSIWVFPKGHIEQDETPDAAARRETREEAGVDGDLLGPIGEPLEFDSGTEAVRVQYYLIRATATIFSDEQRETCWVSVGEARDRLSFDSARAILGAAAAAITAREQPRPAKS